MQKLHIMSSNTEKGIFSWHTAVICINRSNAVCANMHVCVFCADVDVYISLQRFKKNASFKDII